jgi:hypothetical protein
MKTKNFKGSVTTKHGIAMPDGRSYWIFQGKVSVLSAEEMLGFEVNTADSNWLARIESADGARSVNIPGCQIMAVHQGDFAEDGGSVHNFVL